MTTETSFKRRVTFSEALTNPEGDRYAGLRDIMDNHRLEYFKALGYLMTWASHSERYQDVELCLDGFDGDLQAFYSQDGKVNYAIGAIWRDGEYSFHS